MVATSRLLLGYVGGLEELRYRGLSDPYLAICLASKLGEAADERRRIRRHIDVVVLLRHADHTAIFPAPERAIYAEGNLKSDKFDDIITRLSIDPAPFELHYNWLDARVLAKAQSHRPWRPRLADPAFAREALTTVGHLLDQFRTATQNAAVLEVFRREEFR